MITVDEHLTFAETTHTYWLDGIEVLSPTKVFEITGITDFSKVRTDVIERAQGFGRCLHLATELYDKGTLDPATIDPGLAPYLNGWKKFVAESGYQFQAIEQFVYHLGFKYAGMIDRVTTDGVLIEIKSSNTIHVATALQTAAYAMAREKMKLGKIKERLGVRVFEEGYEIVPYKDKTDFDDFLTCLRMAYLKRKLKIK